MLWNLSIEIGQPWPVVTGERFRRVTPDQKYPPKALSDEALGWIVRLYSGEADKADWKAFRAWRAQSAAHDAAATEAEALWNDASELHRDPVTGLIRPGHRQFAPSRRGIITGIVGLGVIGVGGLWTSGLMRSLSADYATGVAEMRVVHLPDGSTATLNAMSAIDLDYETERRRIVLREGQAFFQVKPDHLRLFDVQVGPNTVSALGAAFDVNRNLPDGQVEVSVSEQVVRVSSLSRAGSSSADQSVVVSQDEGVIIAANGRVGKVEKQDVGSTISWRSGMYVAEGRALEDVIAAFRAYYRGWIVIRDDSLKSLKVNAVLDLRTPDASLDALASGLPIRIDHISRFLTVISRA